VLLVVLVLVRVTAVEDATPCAYVDVLRLDEILDALKPGADGAPDFLHGAGRLLDQRTGIELEGWTRQTAVCASRLHTLLRQRRRRREPDAGRKARGPREGAAALLLLPLLRVLVACALENLAKN
jgi:hypothetical protein